MVAIDPVVATGDVVADVILSDEIPIIGRYICLEAGLCLHLCHTFTLHAARYRCNYMLCIPVIMIPKIRTVIFCILLASNISTDCQQYTEFCIVIFFVINAESLLGILVNMQYCYAQLEIVHMQTKLFVYLPPLNHQGKYKEIWHVFNLFVNERGHAQFLYFP